MDDASFDIPAFEATASAVEDPDRSRIRDEALKAQALEPRGRLLSLLDQLAECRRLSRRDSLDLVMALIEDAHSANPVLFGADAADHFARMHETRVGLDR